LNAGTQTLSVTLTPTDSVDYTTATATVQLIVNKATPTVTVSPSSASITSNQALNVTVSVSFGSGNLVPSGSVKLTGGGYSSAATALVSGSATVTIPAGSLSVGTDALTVVYTPDTSGSATYTSATGSASVTVSAQVKLGSTLTVVPTPAVITNQQTVNVSITVAGASGQPAPAGSVTLSSGSYSAQQALTNGAAGITIPAGTLSSGANTITVNYAGDGTYSGSSATAVVTVDPVLMSASAPAAVIPGASTTSTLTITAGSNYAGTMNLGCALTTSPTGAQSLPTCSLSPAALPIAAGGSGTSTFTVKTTAQSGSAMTRPSHNSLWDLGGGTALAGLLLLGFPARRRRWMSLVVLLGALATAVVGCGGGSGGGGGGGGGNGPIVPATTAGTYVFTVTGTDSANSNITASTTVTVTVQ
jgi:hypothetical protein